MGKDKEKNKNHSLKMLGRIAWNKGLFGRKPWHNISGFRPGWNKGLKGIYSKETLEKNRLAHLGKTPTNKGKSPTPEQLRKLSEAHKGNTGSKSGNWKGGITSQNMLVRGSLELKLWRKYIFKRDNYTCQKTQQRGGRLEAHHIDNFIDFPELRFVLDNGITLSEKSHKEFHKKYGKLHNNRKQLVEFLQEA